MPELESDAVGIPLYVFTERKGLYSFRFARRCNLSLKISQTTPKMDEEVPLMFFRDYKIICLLGSGGYGQVFLVQKKCEPWKDNYFALKIMNKTKSIHKPKYVENANMERKILQLIDGLPYLTQARESFQTPNFICLILEIAWGSDLFSHIQWRRFLPSNITFAVAEVVLALSYLHQLGIVYRDIKLENILVDGYGHFQLTDFGLSKELATLRVKNQYKSQIRDVVLDCGFTEYCGTPDYMPPEVVRYNPERGLFNIPPAGFEADWWSLGILTYELLKSMTPFSNDDPTPHLTEGRILSCHMDFTEKLRDFTPEVGDFVQKLCEKNPKKRLGYGPHGYREVMKHPFLQHIDWALLERQNERPPLDIRITKDGDISYFTTDFTKSREFFEEIMTDTTEYPVENEENVDYHEEFKNYAYTTDNREERLQYHAYVEKFLCPVNDDDTLYAIPHSPYVIKKESNSLLSERDGKNRGYFSVVLKAYHKYTDHELAVKVIRKDQCNNVDVPEEFRLLSRLRHMNIVHPVALRFDHEHFFMIYELLELIQPPAFVKTNVKKFILQLANAIRMLSKWSIVHRNITYDNLMVTARGDLKLIDFDTARVVKNNEKLIEPMERRYVVAAPEIVDLNLPEYARRYKPAGYDYRADVWSLGAIMYQMYTGFVPFNLEYVKNSYLATLRILNEEIDHFDRKMFADIPHKSARFIIKSLMNKNPDERMDLNKLLAHEYFYQNKPLRPRPSHLVTVEPLHVVSPETKIVSITKKPLKKSAKPYTYAVRRNSMFDQSTRLHGLLRKCVSPAPKRQEIQLECSTPLNVERHTGGRYSLRTQLSKTPRLNYKYVSKRTRTLELENVTLNTDNIPNVKRKRKSSGNELDEPVRKKRKYVRKINVENANEQTQPSEMPTSVRETTESDTSVKKKRKYVRKIHVENAIEQTKPSELPQRKSVRKTKESDARSVRSIVSNTSISSSKYIPVKKPALKIVIKKPTKKSVARWSSRLVNSTKPNETKRKRKYTKKKTLLNEETEINEIPIVNGLETSTNISVPVANGGDLKESVVENHVITPEDENVANELSSPTDISVDIAVDETIKNSLSCVNGANVPNGLSKGARQKVARKPTRVSVRRKSGAIVASNST